MQNFSVPKTALSAVVTAAVLVSFSMLLFSSTASAQSSGPYPHSAPEKPKAVSSSPSITVKSGKTNIPAQPSKAKISRRVIISFLKGIVFISSVKMFNKNGVSPSVLNAQGLYFKSLPLLNNNQFISSVSRYINKPLTFKGLNNIISLVRSLYKSDNITFIDVTAPPQNVSNGVLQIVVIPYKVGSIKVSGNRYFSNSYIIFQSGIRSGATLSRSALLSDMNWLNKNPFLRSDALLSPGKAPGYMDLDLLTKDVIPFRVYAGYDNQGIPSLGMNEWDAGFNYGNAFGLGQMLSYQIAQSFNARYRSDSLSYDIPFPWHGRVELSGSYSTASPYINQYFSELGRNAQASIYYKQQLAPFHTGKVSFNQTIGAGYDFKTTNNNLAFGGLQVFQGTAQIDQFPIFYNITESDPYGVTSLYNRFVLSPGGMNADNSTASFNTIYAGTRSKYIYDNLDLSRTQYMPLSTQIVSGVDFQAANHNLLYSEQMAAGGIYSAPGYSPDTATGSRGVILNEEFKLPPVNMLSSFGLKGRNAIPVNFGLFWDYADLSSVNNVSGVTGIPNTAVIESTGASLHTVIEGHFDLRFALGWKLRSVPYDRSYGKGLFEDIVVSAGF